MKDKFFNKSRGIKEIIIKQNSSIKEALKIISNNEERVCFVVDKNNKLIASLSDGDIRKGLLKEINTKDKISKVYNKNYVALQQGYNIEDAYKKFSKKLAVIPVINYEGKICDVIKKHHIVPFLDIKSKKILVVGLGYVGLTLSLVLAESGFNVIGYDKNKKLVDKIQNKKSPFYEKGIEKYLEDNVNKNLEIVNQPTPSDIYIITVGTPLNKNNKSPDLSFIKKSIEKISGLIKKNDLIILRSTVPIGCSRNFVIPIIEKKTKLKFGKDIFLAFCPERTIEGEAIKELKKIPQIIGSFCKKSSELAKRVFNEYNFTVIEVSDLESAELCKLIDNSYRDTIFAYTNQLSLLSEKLNLNLVDIIDKVNLGYDRNRIPKPSPGVGGPCLSKDPYILHNSFKLNKLKSDSLVITARRVNENMIKNIFNRSSKIIKKIKKNKKSKIFITGFAFKGFPETSDLRLSTTLDLLNILKKNKYYNIWGHDFKIEPKMLKKLKIKPCSIEQGFNKADIVFIMNNHKKYDDLNIYNLIRKANKKLLFFDAWQLFNPSEIKSIKGTVYASVGSN